jgi:nucleotide-binding universal stress UspA family protein
MFTHILVAFDGSDNARRAAAFTGHLAREQRPPAMVRVVVAVEPVSANLGEPHFSQLAAERTLKGQDLMLEARGLLGAGLDVHEELLFGPPADEIINVAEVRGCDLIVIGARGQSGLRSLLFGSQVQKVAGHAHCPVLVMK